MVPAVLCEQWAWEEVKGYLRTPDLIAREVERLQEEGIDKQLLKDSEIAQASLERHTQGMQRLVRSLRTVEDDLAVIIERELLQAEREKQAMLNTIADLDARIARQEQVTINLRSLYEYCQQVEDELERFEFDDQRLALEALGAEVVANGRDWKLVARFPGSVVEVESVCSNSSRPTSAPTPPARRPARSGAQALGDFGRGRAPAAPLSPPPTGGRESALRNRPGAVLLCAPPARAFQDARAGLPK